MFFPSHYDIVCAYDALSIALELLTKGRDPFFLEYPAKVAKAVEEWGEYGWVPYLPQDNAYRFISSVNAPSGKEEADALMLSKLEKTSDELFLAINNYIEKLGANQITYEEAISTFKNGFYTSCALDLFATIDAILITSQPKINGARRKLAKNAIDSIYAESKSASYLVIAGVTMHIIDTLFKDGKDFDPENEGNGNRNYISHGMNSIIPDKIFCLKLFVLLYNLCMLILFFFRS